MSEIVNSGEEYAGPYCNIEPIDTIERIGFAFVKPNYNDPETVRRLTWDFADNGLQVIHLKKIVLPSKAIEYIYRDAIGKHYYEDMHNYLARHAVTAFMLEHSEENAQSVLLDLKTGSNGRPNLRNKYRHKREWIDDAEMELWNRGLVDNPMDLTIALTQDNVLHTADDTEDALLSLAALNVYRSGFLTIDDIKYNQLGLRLKNIVDLGEVVDTLRRELMSRTWFESKEIDTQHERMPVHQAYTWVLTRDNKIPIVSKDGEKWQLPGGKPRQNESLQETAIRELKEETGVDAWGFSDQLELFGYYEIVEDGPANQPQHYLQARYALHLPLDSDDLPRTPPTEDEEQIESEQIKFVHYVTSDEISDFIPWMKQSEEAQAALARLSAPLTHQ